MYEAQAALALAANAKAAHAHQLTNENLITFLFGGKAIFTLFNEETHTRYTYLVEKKAYKIGLKEGSCYWVSLLTGPHNISDYTYLGSLRTDKDRTFTLSIKSRVGQADLPSVQAISWLLARIASFERGAREDVTAGPLKFWHAGRCGRCNRALTVPESLAQGIGPECAGNIGKGVEKKVKVRELS